MTKVPQNERLSNSCSELFRVVLVILLSLQETLQQECEEIGECVELPVPTDILIAEFDAVLHVGIGIPLDEIVQ